MLVVTVSHPEVFVISSVCRFENSTTIFGVQTLARNHVPSYIHLAEMEKVSDSCIIIA